MPWPNDAVLKQTKENAGRPDHQASTLRANRVKPTRWHCRRIEKCFDEKCLGVARMASSVGTFYNEKYAEKAYEQLRQLHVLELRAAIAHRCKTIAFPAISTGAYRFPIADAALIAIDSVCSFLASYSGIERVRFMLYKEK